MIQTQIRDDRGEIRQLNHNDPEYWEGAYRYEPFPKALYRVTQPGQQEAECRVVKSESEMNALGADWFESPADAKVYFAKLESDMAQAAAEVNYKTSRMSEGAQAEKRAADQASDEHVLDVAAPKKRGRPFKAQPVVE